MRCRPASARWQHREARQQIPLREVSLHISHAFVLDDVVYNGRVSQDSVLSAILKINPLKAQTVDRLSTPFLVFVADFDAAGGGAENLRECLTILWRTMSLELTQVFRHCIGFDNIDEPAQFCAYIQKCQVETTMPFNDYWSLPPDLPTFDLKPYIYSASAAGVFTVAGLFIWRPWLLLLGVLALGFFEDQPVNFGVPYAAARVHPVRDRYPRQRRPGAL